MGNCFQKQTTKRSNKNNNKDLDEEKERLKKEWFKTIAIEK